MRMLFIVESNLLVIIVAINWPARNDNFRYLSEAKSMGSLIADKDNIREFWTRI